MKIIYIIAVIFFIALGFGSGFYVALKIGFKNYKIQKELSDKHLALFRLMCDWAKQKKKNKDFAINYLSRKEYSNIVIYGMSYVGECLYCELKNTPINVMFAIDQNRKGNYENLKIYELEHGFEDADAIVVTPVTYFYQIEAQLKEKTKIPIISVEDIIYDI